MPSTIERTIFLSRHLHLLYLHLTEKENFLKTVWQTINCVKPSSRTSQLIDMLCLVSWCAVVTITIHIQCNVDSKMTNQRNCIFIFMFAYPFGLVLFVSFALQSIVFQNYNAVSRDRSRETLTTNSWWCGSAKYCLLPWML